MLGRLFFPFGAEAYFQGLSSVSFREGIPRKSTCPSKRDHLKGQESSSDHWFWGGYVSFLGSTWRIIPVSKWLIPTMYGPFKPFGRGPTTPGLGDLRSPWLFSTYPICDDPQERYLLAPPFQPDGIFWLWRLWFRWKKWQQFKNMWTCRLFFSRPELSSLTKLECESVSWKREVSGRQ